MREEKRESVGEGGEEEKARQEEGEIGGRKKETFKDRQKEKRAEEKAIQEDGEIGRRKKGTVKDRQKESDREKGGGERKKIKER